MLSAEIQQAAIDAANRHGVDPNTLLTILNIEDPSGDPAAVNGNGSSAVGLGQFMPATATQYGLSDRTDPIASVDAAARYMADNNATLTRTLGRPPTIGEQYLAYQQGASGATKLLTNPDAPASSIIGNSALVANLPKSMQGQAATMTAGQFASVWTDRAAQVAGLIPPSDVPGTGVGSPGDAPLSSTALPYNVSQLYGQHVQPVPLAPVLKNVSGSPDERLRVEGSQQTAPAASTHSVAAAPAQHSPLVSMYTPSTPAPAAAAPATWTSSKGDVYRVGDVLNTGGGADGTGSYVITANGPQKLNYVPANTGPTVMSGVVGQAAQQAVSSAQAAIPSAVSGIGSFLGKMFGGGGASAAPNSSGSPDDRDSALLATVASGTATGTVGGKPTAVATDPALSPLASLFNNAANSSSWPTQATKMMESGGGALAGGQSLESRTEAPPSLASFYAPNSSGSPDDRQTVNSAPASVATTYPYVGVGGIAPVAAPAAMQGTDITPTEHSLVVNPAYTAWEKQQPSPFSNPGVQGLSPDDRDSPTGVAGPVPVSPVSTPAPPKYVVVAKPAVARPAPPPAPVAVAPAPVQKPMTIVQMYQAQGLSPSAAYNAAAAKALASQPNPYMNNRSSGGGAPASLTQQGAHGNFM